MIGIVRQVFSEHFDAYRRAHNLCWRERWAAFNIRTCRTAAQGAHVHECPEGHYKVIRYNSCRHRSCPLCGAEETEEWIQAQQARALPCRYHQIVFTIAEELHNLWRYNRRHFTNLFFRAAWECLRDFFAHPKWLGGLPGAIAAFQSWGETLNLHPHLHFLVTAGALSPQGVWLAPKSDFLFPAAALRAKFQGKFLDYLRRDLRAGVLIPPHGRSLQQCLNELNRLGRRKFNVRIQPAYQHPKGLIKYLAFYFRRGPISERRIHSYDGNQLFIRYKRPDEHTRRSFPITAHEFISRILTHVPPKGLRVVRAYGLFHHRCRPRLEQARLQLGALPSAPGEVYPPGREAPPPSQGQQAFESVPDYQRCPLCGQPMVCTIILHPGPSPPERIAA